MATLVGSDPHWRPWGVVEGPVANRSRRRLEEAPGKGGI